MDSKQKFKLYCSDITKSIDPNYNIKDKTKPLILEGVASTSDIDLEGDFITPQCIESFKLQATNCNIHNNHNVGLGDVIGTVLEVLDSDSQTLKIKFSILPMFRRHIEECIDNGVKLGLSIGGTILDYDTGDDGLKIKNMMLHEISLTPLPANWNTMGTVTHETKSMDVIEAKCLNGVCKQFINNVKKAQEQVEMEKRYYTKDEEAQFMSEDRVVELINEALNNFATNAVTEERVAEIIDEKLAEFVEKAKALEQAEIEKAQKKAKEEEKEEEEEEKEELEIEKKDEEEEEPEIEEEEEEPEEEKKGKKGKKSQSSVGDLTPEEFGSLIAHAVQLSMEPPEPVFDFASEIKSLKEDIHSDIAKAVADSKVEIEKSLFDGLMKNSKPQTRTKDAQIKKFLKNKAEKEEKASTTLNVSDIAKTLAKQHQ